MKQDRSHELYERLKRSMAGGVSSNARLRELPIPPFFDRGEGSRLYDVDGNEHIDYVLGRGPVIFGHSPDFLVDAVIEAMQTGQVYGAQHELEIEVSETIQKIVPCAELVRYASSGTEVVQAALRLARAYTGRPKFIMFNDQYHGWMDSVYHGAGSGTDEDRYVSLANSPGMSPGAADEVVILPWKDTGAVKTALDRHGSEIAAIITSPAPESVVETAFLTDLRDLCDQHEVVLILDEVITGFRLALGGGQEVAGVTPDLATYAKALGGGFPISMVAGKRDIMSLLGDGTVSHGGTLNSNVMCMASAKASLAKLMENDGAIYRRLYASGEALMDGLKERALKHELDVTTQGTGPLFQVSFADDLDRAESAEGEGEPALTLYEQFQQGMVERGIRLERGGARGGGWFVSSAHTEEDIERTLDVADEVFGTL